MTEAGKASVTEQTEKVLQHHLNAFSAGDVAAILADYADDALIITANETFKGLAEIRRWFTHLFADVFPPGRSSLKLSKQVVEGEVAFILWSGTAPNLHVPFATDTFILRDGKIVAQTFAAQMETK
jgi:ketosteroid isomerase-like protein